MVMRGVAVVMPGGGCGHEEGRGGRGNVGGRCGIARGALW